MKLFPKISVCIITYKHEEIIKQCLDGVLIQDYPGEVEIIIANDNSPDNSHFIINQFIAEKVIPPNFLVKYTKHEATKGAVDNFSWVLIGLTLIN